MKDKMSNCGGTAWSRGVTILLKIGIAVGLPGTVRRDQSTVWPDQQPSPIAESKAFAGRDTNFVLIGRLLPQDRFVRGVRKTMTIAISLATSRLAQSSDASTCQGMSA